MIIVYRGVLIALLATLSAARAGDWPGFRGDGSSSAAGSYPLEWNPDTNIAWRTALSGYGQSSPVIHGDTIYTTTIEGRKKETLIVQAFELATGKERWQKTFRSGQPGNNDLMTSRAAPSPAADAEGVYAFFESGDLIALKPDGTVRWQRSLSEQYGPFQNNHGLGSSLAQTKDSLIALVDHNGPSYLIALNKADGKTLWKTDRPTRASWTSPTVATVKDGQPIVVVSSGGAVSAYSAADGKMLWNLDEIAGNNIPSPAVSGEWVVYGTGSGGGRSQPMEAGKSTGGIHVVDGKAELAWQAPGIVTGMASPVIVGNEVYFADKAGLAHCLDLKTGKSHYEERLPGSVWATPIVADGRIYFFGKDGVTTVVPVGKEFEIIATNRLWSEADAKKRQAEAQKKLPPGAGGGFPMSSRGGPYATVGDTVYAVAAVDGAFIIRTGSELLCIRAAKK